MHTLLRLTALTAFALTSSVAFAQARLQVIHNAADPGAAVVDVYVNGGILLDDFAFRAATPYIDVASDTDLEIAVAPGTSASADDAIYTETFNLPAGSTTQLIANGVLDPSMFEANPDGASTAFQLLVGANAQEEENGADRTGVRVVHGATDAPTVDIRSNKDVNVDGVIRVNDASYGAITDYVRTETERYIAYVTTADGTPVAAFDADLSEAGETTLTVLASGFLSPDNDMNGPAFGLLAVDAEGNASLLPAAPARLQVIHNAADPGAAVVDVYVNGDIFLDDFAFRAATPFVFVPSGTDLEVAVAPGTSASAEDAIFTETFNLPSGSATQLIANGVLDPSMFEANPDGESTAFQLLVGADAQAAGRGGKTSVRVVHGATDAPTVDVRSGGAILVDDAAYTAITGYLRLPAASYTLDITTAEGGAVASFTADLSGAPGAAVTVLASGFLSPENDMNGEAFGLLAVFGDGTSALLPAATTLTARAETEGMDRATPMSAENPFATALAAPVLALDAPFPNPAVGSATVPFSLAEAGDVRLAVVDALGREVALLAEGTREAGAHRAALPSGTLAPGTYVVLLQANGDRFARPLTVVR
ncbi:MAG TPA: DUF4397 domain-containing protein [Bacteroidetes bacterium]|nr:DUF4397 domain-containing protein [Bacteroidota bacterium]HIL56888.1 DUF4397 domain-containing protein [Rhodothermales bacterium]